MKLDCVHVGNNLRERFRSEAVVMRRWIPRAWYVGIPLLALWLGAAWAQSLDTSAGQTVYGNTCIACHQKTGQGIPGTFPPLAGTVPEFLQKGDQGRKVLMEIVVYGMKGAVTIAGTDYNGTLPTWGKVLDDQQIADVLNYVTHAWDNAKALPDGFKPFTADEVKGVRGQDLTPEQTLKLRNDLGL